LNLVLIDEENRRYFKQQEITMFRRKSKYLISPIDKSKLTDRSLLPIYNTVDDGYPPDDE
jgi:hypothetical protein